MIAKFDYKEKLALGCLYMKDKFLIQDRDDQISYRVGPTPYSMLILIYFPVPIYFAGLSTGSIEVV